MSEAPVTTEVVEEPTPIELPSSPDAAFGALMDALAPEEDKPSTEEGGDQAAADAAATGSAAAPAGDTGADKAAAPAEPAGDGGKPTVEDGAAAPVSTDLPEGWTATAADLTTQLGAISTGFEESVTKEYQATALKEVREEHAKYFEAVEMHPRQLVGQEVPSLSGNGTERLKDSQDAEDWQEGVKKILVGQVRDKAAQALDADKDYFNTVHASIDLFKNNLDLVPGAASFDKELANQFAELAGPYAIKVDEKLIGYSIPTQPIIDQLRAKLVAARAAAPTTDTTTPPAKKAETPPAKKADEVIDPPQATITSKAGDSVETEDYSDLFRTLDGFRV